MTDSTILCVRDLSYRLGSRTLWENVSFAVPAGGAIALRGPSGQGKSTLLRCIGGLERPTRGQVSIAGTRVDTARERERRGLRRQVVGFITQDHAVVPEWTVAQNMSVVRSTEATARRRGERSSNALLAVGLGGRHRTRAGLLSGGEQQRVAVARVLAQRPRLVLADEPTASLDEASARRVRAGLDELRRSGTAVVVATHDQALLEWAGQEYLLSEGDRSGTLPP